MRVNTFFTAKNTLVFLVLFYVDAQLLDKLFAAKGVGDIIVYLVSLFFMLVILIAHSHFLCTKINRNEEETEK